MLEAAATGYREADMLVCAAASRWQLGKLLGDGRGQTLVQDAKAFMNSQAIRNPVRILRIFSPGFPETE